ncbi:MAG TPA: winged helix DNA-binding domain-containing protein [Sphingobacteriaceae bacterium]
MLKPSDISCRRLISQKIRCPAGCSAADAVAWMGAIQAQDYPMSVWAVALRLENHRHHDVEAAFNSGEILRTHVMRPTWHLVSRENIRWMVALTAPRIRNAVRSRWKELELDGQAFIRSYAVMERMLGGGNHLPREEILAEIGKSLPVSGQRGAHLLFGAELDGLVCSGPIRQKKHTYCLLEERVPAQAALSEDEALGRLAGIYFRSHGPATLKDFAWWSGLSLTSAKKGTELARSGLLSETIGGKVYWSGPEAPAGYDTPGSPEVFLLPAYDEFLISYQDRSPSIGPADQSYAFSNNGIFRPVIIVDGIARGIWKRTIKKDRVIVEPTFFVPVHGAIREAVAENAARYGQYLGLKPEVLW